MGRKQPFEIQGFPFFRREGQPLIEHGVAQKLPAFGKVLAGLGVFHGGKKSPVRYVPGRNAPRSFFYIKKGRFLVVKKLPVRELFFGKRQVQRV